ncbi:MULTISPECIES: iron-containing alcohol dehydrogenase family protein [Cyanophyceae]|uniref:iron-containing alcohol dehydrogenase family protein n=1 Tax=Cyanophyceae TaxID=3028117 RepID=UPI00016DC51F|nr:MULTISPECIES: iron-containing alcohol dehydrogenase family protein [Cyanophyceae]ACA98612.1 glycerol dehydrogenase, iron containing [Picosynechococcus sp. PCC 7002]SMQ78415.1 glycerol dehydrogenase [Synechococcus sp. 7002]
MKKPAATQTQTVPMQVLIAPAQVLKGNNALAQAGAAIARWGKRPFVVGGQQSLEKLADPLQTLAEQKKLDLASGSYSPDCSEASLQELNKKFKAHKADFVIGIGGGKALDTAKLLAHQQRCPIVTVPTSAATCAAWTALSNIYSDQGAFQYDVALEQCPNLLILDYELVRTAPQRTLIAGIGDAIAKWYEASVSSGHSPQTLTIAAVQEARILRDLLFQKSSQAIADVHSPEWQEVVDATVLLAGVIGGLGGANCRTVAAHAVHNGLTHLPAAHGILHGEKVAYGILVQLRLEEVCQKSQLAETARQQLLQFYRDIGLPKSLADLGLNTMTLAELRQVAEITCQPQSDIHRLPFTVNPDQLMAAMVSTEATRESTASEPQSAPEVTKAQA